MEMQFEGSASFNDDQLQRYMGSYVTHSIDTSSRAPLSTCAYTVLPPAAGAGFRVPALHCSFPSSLHPQYEVVKEQCEGWIMDVAQPPCAAARQLLQDCLIPRLICRNIPNATSVTRLVHVIKMVAWLFIADDDNDHPGALGADDANTMHHASQVLSILRCTSIPAAAPAASDHGTEGALPTSLHVQASLEVSERKKTALLALSKLWAEMCREMSPRLCTRFVSTMEDYFGALKVQATYRKANRLPDIEAYKEIRRQACFILPCLVLVEYAVGIDLDEATHANARIQDFRNAATDYMWLCNDLISCKVEIEVGDYFNMPSIIYVCNVGRTADCQRRELTFQAAVDSVVNMAHDMDARCVVMLQTMFQEDITATSSSPSPTVYSSAHEIIRTYVRSLCNCMSGSLAWHLESVRYASTN